MSSFRTGGGPVFTGPTVLSEKTTFFSHPAPPEHFSRCRFWIFRRTSSSPDFVEIRPEGFSGTSVQASGREPLLSPAEGGQHRALVSSVSPRRSIYHQTLSQGFAQIGLFWSTPIFFLGTVTLLLFLKRFCFPYGTLYMGDFSSPTMHS